jgi:hypothetical protein
MFIKFNNGVNYRYDAVPYPVFASLAAAESVGQHFHRNIRGKYTCQKLDYDPFTVDTRMAA